MFALPGGAGATTGVDWLPRTGNGGTKVTGGGGQFTAVGPTGTVKTSPDGVVWTAQSTTSVQNLLGVAYGTVSGAGRLVAVAATRWVGAPTNRDITDILRSSNGGSTWTKLELATADAGYTDIVYGEGLFVIAGSGGTSPQFRTSPDGITWTAVPYLRDLTSSNASIAYGDDKFVSVSNYGKAASSLDGSAWTVRTPAAAIHWSDVVFGAGLWVAVSNTANTAGSNEQIMTSPDGATWTLRSHPGPVRVWESVEFGNGQFVAVSSDGTNRVMTSPDGITWTDQVVPCAGKGLGYLNGMFVGVADGPCGSPAKYIFSTGSFLAAVPTAPYVVVGDASATVRVVAGAGEAATSFTITASPGGATCTVTGASGSCTVTGLTNGTAYTFTATATNVGGTTVASPASLSVTPVAPAGSGSGGSGSGGSGAGGSGSGGSGSGGSGAVAPTLVIVLTPSRRTVAAGQTLTLRLDFSNTGTAAASGAKACVTIPEGFTVVDADGGTVTGNQICFNVGALAAPDAKVQARRAGRAPASSSTRRFNVVLRATTAVTRVVTFSTTVSAAGVRPRTVVVKAKPIRIKPSRNASAESPTG